MYRTDYDKEYRKENQFLYHHILYKVSKQFNNYMN